MTAPKFQLLCVLLGFWGLGGPGFFLAETPFEAFNRGCQQLDAKNYAMAVQSFIAASETFEKAEHRTLAIYNSANACFLQARADEPLDPQSSLTYYRQAARAYRACLEMFPDFENAAWNLELTLLRLERISQEVENDVTDQSDDPGEESDESGEQNEGESDEENEGEMEETDEEGSSDPSAQSGDQNAMDLDAQDIPPPMVEPEDILEQEIANAEARQKGKPGKYKPVEKDW